MEKVTLMMRKATLQIAESCRRNPTCDGCPFYDTEEKGCKLKGERPSKWKV